MNFDRSRILQPKIEQPKIEQSTIEQSLQQLQAVPRWRFISSTSSPNDAESIPVNLELPELPPYSLHLFQEVGSTNTMTWQLIQEGASAGTVVIAQTQQAGRGQWGRQWQSSRGGLYLSMALTPNLPVSQASQLTLSSAVGIATGLQHCGIPVQIKWLNDLVVQGRKLGGILTETRTQQGRIHQAVVGVGINWSNPVPEVGINLQTILAQEEPDEKTLLERSKVTGSFQLTSLETLAAVVLQGLRLGYNCWREQGALALTTAYETLLMHRGKSVVVHGVEGTIAGINAAGQLRVCLHQSDRADQENSGSEMLLNPGEIQLGYSS